MSRFGKIVIPLLVVGLSCGAFVMMIKFRRTVVPKPIENSPPSVEVQRLERENFRFIVRSQGSVEAATSVRLVSQVDGQIVRISGALKKGGVFSQGEVLVEIDDRDYALAVTRASAQVATAQLRVATAEAEAKIALEDWEEIGGGDKASALLLREPQMLDARAALAAAEADLARAKLDLERTKIVAPFEGRVRSATVDLGQFVRRGEELASVFSIDRVELVLPLPLADFEFLDLPAERTAAAFEEKPTFVTLVGKIGRQQYQWQGEVVRVDGEVDVNSRMSSIVVSVTDPYRGGTTTATPPLKVGMFVEAEIEGRTSRGVYVVRRDQLWESDRALVVDSGGLLRIRNLDILRADRTHAIVQGGFELGDQLCLSIVDIPQDGIEVKALNSVEGESE